MAFGQNDIQKQVRNDLQYDNIKFDMKLVQHDDAIIAIILLEV